MANALFLYLYNSARTLHVYVQLAGCDGSLVNTKSRPQLCEVNTLAILYVRYTLRATSKLRRFFCGCFVCQTSATELFIAPESLGSQCVPSARYV